MQCYYVYGLGQLCDERRDELARAYREAQPPPPDRQQGPARNQRRSRLRNLLQRPRGAPALRG